MSEALKALLRSLSIIGIDSERVAVKRVDEPGACASDVDYRVEIATVEGASILVRVTNSYWRYPGMPCYFVNFSHTNGNFMACMGTPHVEQALFDLGSCFHMIPPIQGD